MLKLGLSNIRRLKQVKPIEIRRITLLVGRNSSGKSTFLRTFPLLRQSAATRTSAPILWFGDLVDFGTYEHAVSNNEPDKSISFEFEIGNVDFSFNNSLFTLEPSTDTRRSYATAGLEVALAPYGGRTVSSLRLSLPGLDTFVVQIDYASRVTAIELNGVDILDCFPDIEFRVEWDEPFPQLSGRPTKDDRQHHQNVYLGRWANVLMPALAEQFDVSVPELEEEGVRDFLNGVFKLRVLEPAGVLRLLEAMPLRGILGRRKNWEKWLSGERFRRMRRIWTANQCIPALAVVCNRLKSLFSDVLYVGPARATSQRYYRYQDLAVSGIDPDGKNFAMFLNSLRGYQLDSFSSWVEKLFGYRVVVSPEGGHISIELTEGDARINIVDTGYGVSQVLPVLGQIWWASTQLTARGGFLSEGQEDQLIAIEQPELHLHPAHQALLADALVESPTSIYSSTVLRQPKFIVETHSETLVNRLGQLIAEGRLGADDVQIVIFEPDEGDLRRTNVAVSRFAETGELINWPYGFFQANV